MSIIEAKRALREQSIARRSSLLADHPDRFGPTLARQDLAALELRPDSIVSAFASMADEIDVNPLLARLHGQGQPLCLPVIVARRQPLIFRRWRPGDVMDKGMWGIAQPAASQPEVAPDVMLVPLLAFDRQGWRLGYGGGYFDRTIAGLRAAKPVTTVGIALDELEVDAVPHLDYDQPLDWVLTPSGLRQLRISHELPVSR